MLLKYDLTLLFREHEVICTYPTFFFNFLFIFSINNSYYWEYYITSVLLLPAYDTGPLLLLSHASCYHKIAWIYGQEHVK